MSKKRKQWKKQQKIKFMLRAKQQRLTVVSTIAKCKYTNTPLCTYYWP